MGLETQSFQDHPKDVTGESVREEKHFHQRTSSREISSPVAQLKATTRRHRGPPRGCAVEQKVEQMEAELCSISR